MNISLSNINFMINGSYKSVDTNNKTSEHAALVFSKSNKTTSDKAAYPNEKNTASSSMIYADTLLPDTKTMRASDTSKTPPVSTDNSDKSLIEMRYGPLNCDPTKSTCYSRLFSDGSDSLTPEQETYLKERYDLNNLTWDEYKRYLGDLTSFNVLSSEAYHKLVRLKETIQRMVDNGAYNGASPPDSWTPIPDGVFNMYDYLVEEHGKALLIEKLDKAYNVNPSTFVSSFYEKLIGICNSIKE